MGCSGSKSGDVQEPKPAEGGEGGDAAAAQKQEVEQNGSTPAGECTPQKNHHLAIPRIFISRTKMNNSG